MMAGAMAIPFAVVALVVLTISPWFPLTATSRPRRHPLPRPGSHGGDGIATTTWRSSPISARRDRCQHDGGSPIVQAVPGVLLLIVVLPSRSRSRVAVRHTGKRRLRFAVLFGSSPRRRLGKSRAQYLRCCASAM